MGQADRTATRLKDQEAPKAVERSAQPEAPVFVECLTSSEGGISAMASASAPFLYFDHAAFYGTADGICEMTLVARRRTAQRLTDPVGTDYVTIAHLRCGVEALGRLQAAIAGIHPAGALAECREQLERQVDR